jgi:NAD(P)H-hydrate repair Nnr-like enzyme with NAD(P)H-hydrate dehydratase domain
MATLQYVLATSLSLVVFVVLANVIVDLYARGAVRAAVDEAARAAARVDGTPAECAARARDVLTGLLGAHLRSGVEVTCSETEALVSARADVRLAGWLAFVPDWSFSLVGTAVKERSP